MTRKLLPCLLAAGIVALVGCNKQGAEGTTGSSSAGAAAAPNGPLTYVPADTPYVIANIDSLPADVTNDWIARFDKTGKAGDMYADSIDSFEKLIRDQGASCGSASGGGSGSAMQDPPAGQSAAGDQAPAAAIDASSPAANASAAVAGPAAATADISAPAAAEDKCSPAAMAERDLEIKRLDAVKSEVAGKDSKSLFDLIGLSPQAHMAFFGIGLVPVLRVELDKPDNLRSLIGRVETKSGSKLTTGKVGNLDYWIAGDSKSNTKLDAVFAISGNQFVATLAPVKASDADLKTLFGLDKPAKSLADSGDLAALAKKMNYLSYGVGYFDSTKLVALLKAPPTPLATSFMTATGSQRPVIDATCSAEYDQIAAAWPRISFGYSDLSAKHMAVHAIVETRADIAKDLETLRAPMPGLGAAQDSLVDFGFAANLTKLPDLATKYADAVAKSPWKCAALAGLNQSAEQSKTTLTNPGFAGSAPLFHGLHAIMDKIDLKPDQPTPDFAGVFAIGSDNPAGLLGMAGSMVPGLATLGLTPNGGPKPLPPMPNLPVNAPMFAAMTDKVLGLAIGTGEDAKLANAMKVDDAKQPLIEFGAKGDIYHLIAQFERKSEQTMTDPAAQKNMEQTAKMMDIEADWFKHVDVTVELTDTGIELKESVDLQ